MKKAMTDTGRRAERLWGLRGSAPGSVEDEQFVLEQLESARSGLESLAARVLATWRRPHDKEHIRSWIMARLVHQNVGFRPDLVAIFRVFDDPADKDWLIALFCEHRALRSSLSHALRDLPHGPSIVRNLVDKLDSELILDVINGFMWSRRRYGKALRTLAQHKDASIQRAAKANLALFERYPDRYK